MGPLAAALWVGAAVGAGPNFTLTGTVSWSHPTPCAPALISRDAHVCGALGPVYRQCVEADDRGRIGGAVVYLEGASGKRPKPSTTLIDQLNCTFSPRVQAFAVGSRVQFINSDPVLHNVRVLDPAGNTLGNYALPVKGQRTPALAFPRAGRYEVVCEAGHGWMNAHLLVFDHPYFAVTPPGGGFQLRGVPKGSYRLIAWHPDLGRVERPVEVQGDAAISLVLSGVLGSAP
ncbi:MAG: hypothetical protein IPG45_03725 [Deltaproteobacteria bacterium]|jgi:plastocyanin|nr:hypothetical protein [Deltaproteobacteria bacterium]